MIVRTRRFAANFTVIPNSLLRDERLSYRARGILCDLLTRPEDWSPKADHLAAHSPREGQDAVLTALKEAEEAGYVHRVRERDAQGRLRTVTYVYDHPREEPASGLPSQHSDETDETGSGSAGSGSTGPGSTGSGSTGAGSARSLRSTGVRSTEGRNTEEETPQPRSSDSRSEPDGNSLSGNPDISPQACDLTRLLAQSVQANGFPLPAPRSKARQRWLVEMDRLLRLGPPGQGGRVPDSPEEVAEVIRWATADPFWRTNIRSAPKFRAQYPALRLRMTQDRQHADGPPLDHPLFTGGLIE